MSVQLNHTIVWCRDKEKSATFFTEVFGLPSATPFGPMLVVPLNNDVSIDFYENDGEISSQHYAFLISEEEFDQIFARVRDRGLQVLGRSLPKTPRRDQPERRRPRHILRGPRRPFPRNPHTTVRERWVDDKND